METFVSKDNFVAHLSTSHGISASRDVVPQVQCAEVARKGLGSFWCGYCNTVKYSTAEFGPKMVLERNDHILSHEKHTDLWVEIGGKGMTKGELKALRFTDNEGALLE